MENNVPIVSLNSLGELCLSVRLKKIDNTCAFLGYQLGKLYVFSAVINTYVKTSVPQPAVSVKRRGPRSRAGLMAAPQLADIDMEIPRTTVATIGGISFGGAGAFLFSSKLRMHNISMPVPTT